MSDKLNQAELLQVLISNAVEKGIRAAVQEELKPIKEALNKVTILTAKILKESVAIPSNSAVAALQEQVTRRIPQLGKANASNMVNEAAPSDDMYKNLADRGAAAGYRPDGGNLPDIDIPVPKIYKKVTN